MNRLHSFFKKIRIGSILAIFIAGVALFLTQMVATADAANATNKNPNGLIYSAPDTKERSGIGQVNPKVFERDVESIPAQRQPVIDRSDPDVKILEKVGDAFREGSSFLKSDIGKASEEALENAERKGER
jgi:hypothetical protein